MKKAIIQPGDFSIDIVPTEFHYSPLGDMYEGSYDIGTHQEPNVIPMNMIDIQYSLISGEWKKKVPTTNQAGEEMIEEHRVEFNPPFVFDTGQRSIPYGLYLLIESYRNQPSEAGLTAINAQIAGFAFVNSMAGFVLRVSDIK
jgi:hypothetical protein